MVEELTDDEMSFDEDEASLDEAELSWSQSWHLPVLILGTILTFVGMWVAAPSRESAPPSRYLDAAERYLEARDYDSTHQQLAGLDAALEEQETTLGDFDKRRRAMLSGDLLYLEQRRNEESLEATNRAIVNHYAFADELKADFDNEHIERWATTLVALDENDAALKKLGELTPDARHPILRNIIEGMEDQPTRDDEHLLSLLTHFENDVRADPDAGVEPGIWGTELRARVLLEDDQPQAAIDFLDRRMAHFMDLGAGKQIQALMVRRAQASQQLAKHDEAQFWFNKAANNLDTADPLNGEILVGLGQIALAKSDDIATALGYFARASEAYSNTPAEFAALVGRADCEARGGEHREARKHFATAIKLIESRPVRQRDDDRQAIRNALETHYGLNFDQHRYELALDYLMLAKRVESGEPKPDLTLALARTHERLGEQYRDMGKASRTPDQPESLHGSVDELFQLAAEHFDKSAGYYHQFARSMTVEDDASHSEGLWLAAVNYDRAERHGKAIEAYIEFVQKRPNDPNALAARNRLGRAFMAQRQFDTARDYFAALIEERPKSPDVYESYVPLAQCHAALGEVKQAEHVLRFVVDNHPALTPTSSHYRDALIELGRLYYDQGEYERAIERLDEAVQRYADDREAGDLKYRLANAYRRSVESIDAERAEATTQSRRQMLTALREERLRNAETLFDDSIRLFEQQPAAARTALDQQFYRNAFFYRADCVYDLGQFRDAIPLYDVAAMKFEKDPASLVALVQIVNAYCALGDSKNARVANERARWQLRRIPDGAFDDPTLPMNRELWEQWLRNSSEMGLFDHKAARDRGA